MTIFNKINCHTKGNWQLSKKKEWYFVSKIGLTYWEKKLFVTRTYYFNSKRSEQFVCNRMFFNWFDTIGWVRMPIETNNWDVECRYLREQVRKEKYLWKLQGGPRHFIFMLANCAELHNYTYLKSSTLKSRVGLDYTRMGYEVLIFGNLK